MSFSRQPFRGESMESLMLTEIREQPEAVRKSFVQNRPVIDEILSGLREKPVTYIYLVARGTSDHVGIYAKYLGEFLLGKPVCLSASSIINIYGRSLDLSAALTLAISQSGEGPDLLGVVKDANRSNSLTVGITNFEKSTLAREVNFALLCHAGEEKSVAATKTCTTSMMAGATLLSRWAGVTAHWEMVPEVIAKTLTFFEAIGEKITPFIHEESCVVLARGFNYAAAMETALKIQETCYINARGFSTADFKHGPIAMLHHGFPVIVYAFNGPALTDVRDTLAYLKQIGTHTLLITNNPELAGEASDTLYIPGEVPEEITPFISVVCGQIFAYHLARAKGLNPDAPRGLKKVTKTL